jgi:hypothetical protein
MIKGPLAVAWGEWTISEPQAGALSIARVALENTGSVAWRDSVLLAYHWFDLRGNPIVWDGERTSLPVVGPGERVTVEAPVRAPIPPGRYTFALDLVAEFRVWFSQLGSELDSREIEVIPRAGEHHAELPPGVEPAEDWAERVAAAHSEGYAVVAGSIDWQGSLTRRRPKELAPYAPGGGRVPGFSYPLVCPSVIDGIELETLPDVAGLPAFAAPSDEPWVFDGRAVLRARPA